MITSGPINTSVFDQGGSNYIQRIDYDVNNNAIYLGWAQAGTANSDARWRIIQNTYSLSAGAYVFTASAFPSGSPSFTFVWDNRASYAYS